MIGPIPCVSDAMVEDCRMFETCNTALKEEEVDEGRERYAMGVLIMLHPFRRLENILYSGSTMWASFLRRKDSLNQCAFYKICKTREFFIKTGSRRFVSRPKKITKLISKKMVIR